MSISAFAYSPNAPLSLQGYFATTVLEGGHDESSSHDYSVTSAIHDESDTQNTGQSQFECDLQTYDRYASMFSNIESLINSYDFVGAAEEILKLNIGEIPQSLFDRYANSLDIISDKLSTKDTYLNAQLASQSLTVMAIQDELEIKGIVLGADEVGGFLSMAALSGQVESVDLLESPPFIQFDWVDEGIGAADEYNPQLSPDTSAVSRFMTGKSLEEHREAALSNGGVHGQQAYTLELRLPF